MNQAQIQCLFCDHEKSLEIIYGNKGNCHTGAPSNGANQEMPDSLRVHTFIFMHSY